MTLESGAAAWCIFLRRVVRSWLRAVRILGDYSVC